MRRLQKPRRNSRAPARPLIFATGYVGRFAPSPSGPLHAGSLVSALASWLDARAHNGRWLLRFEDVDSERCHPQYIELIRQQLSALGLCWDAELPIQSSRTQHYQHVVQNWLAQGTAYACACTRRDLAPFRGHGETCYPGTCRTLHLPEAGQAIRMRLPSDSRVEFVDRLLGPQTQDVAHQCGDVVLRRRQGDYTYQFAVSVDDAEQGITHVVRGEDLLASTGRQMLIIQQLGHPAPTYLHHPLLMDAKGNKLSKSTGAASIGLSNPQETLINAARQLSLNLPNVLPTTPLAQLLDEAITAWTLLIPNSSGKIEL